MFIQFPARPCVARWSFLAYKDAPVAAMNLLLVEDDRRVSASLQRGLQEALHTVAIAHTLADARAALEQTAFDAIVLDRGLPDGDGLELLPALHRKVPRPFVLVLTARDQVEDRVSGLDAGADDYLVKPFSFSELEARLRALSRRPRGADPHTLRVADLELDLLARRATRAGREILLSQREFELLAYLARAAGQIVSRERLSRDVWKIRSRATPMDNLIDVFISHLRDKVDKEFSPKLLHTIRGVGFRLSAAP
jgi:DNA-binding response OmpR family regulator